MLALGAALGCSSKNGTDAVMVPGTGGATAGTGSAGQMIGSPMGGMGTTAGTPAAGTGTAGQPVVGSPTSGGTGAAMGGTGGVVGGMGAQAGTAGAGAPAGTGVVAGTGVAAGTGVVAGTGVAAGTGGTGAGAGSGTCVGDWEPGDYPPDISMETYLDISGVDGQNGNTRQYKVHVPPSYDCTNPAPVVFCLHGFLQTPVMFCVNGSSMPEKSDEAGFVLVMPLGYQNSWNGAGCCGGANAAGLDDVSLMRAIFAEVQQHLNVDAKRVFITGLSNGGYMSYRAACEAPDLFAAVAPGAGGLQGGFETSCSPSEPISILDIHGTADPLVAYALQEPSLNRIASQNGCATTTSPAAQPPSGGDTTCVSYDGCPAGIEVTGCTVQGGGHVWFGDENCGTGAAGACAVVGANSMGITNTDAIWDFFSRHSK